MNTTSLIEMLRAEKEELRKLAVDAYLIGRLDVQDGVGLLEGEASLLDNHPILKETE
jgi:hypothetical protein